jgi:hypothetical protein
MSDIHDKRGDDIDHNRGRTRQTKGRGWGGLIEARRVPALTRSVSRTEDGWVTSNTCEKSMVNGDVQKGEKDSEV